MKPVLVVLATAAIALGAALSSRAAAPLSSATAAKPTFFSPPRELVLYGHVKTLTRKGSRYKLRFDPALWLGGVTANRAAVEDRVIPPGDPVPNDYYIRDEGHRLLTYLVPPTAHATVIANPGGTGFRSVRVPISELAEIVKGKNPQRRPLLDRRNGLGYWIRVATDAVRSFDQQYQP
jgi:hypothetical protein